MVGLPTLMSNLRLRLYMVEELQFLPLGILFLPPLCIPKHLVYVQSPQANDRIILGAHLIPYLFLQAPLALHPLLHVLQGCSGRGEN